MEYFEAHIPLLKSPATPSEESSSNLVSGGYQAHRIRLLLPNFVFGLAWPISEVKPEEDFSFSFDDHSLQSSAKMNQFLKQKAPARRESELRWTIPAKRVVLGFGTFFQTSESNIKVA